MALGDDAQGNVVLSQASKGCLFKKMKGVFMSYFKVYVVLSLLISVVLGAVVIYVATHFISKIW